MINQQIERLLPLVTKPGRYVGGEMNSVVKEKREGLLRFAFCFPDTYEVGMSHLGMKILYSLFNERDDIWCERVFAPWVDMEDLMRQHHIPLYGLESGDPLRCFDFIGFTLQYELSYTNVLNMLDLGQIPVRSEDRGEQDPIVVAGGPCACNPEPLADFIDIFFLGEGEEVDLEVMDLYRACREEGVSRREFLRRASKVPGCYVPALYDVSYEESGVIHAVTPKEGAPAVVHKRVMMDMDKSYYPDKFVVPFIDIVHDRAVSEVMRGCIRGCRFCQAGFLYRPLREKSVPVINEQCRALCESTGYDEVSLSSLSTSDYSELNGLLDTMLTWTKERKVGISLPSLRVDGFSTELTEKIKTVRKSGLTFAPEAGTQRLRDVINKNVREDELMKTVDIAFRAGWSRVKLYFMIGLPTETMEDVEGIPALGQKVIDAFYACKDRPKGPAVSVTVSAAAFVPKPFTPFQWEPQDTMESFREKQQHLVHANHSRKLQVNYHAADGGFLEAVFARGDRRLCAVLEEAWRRGCRFDGWDTCFSMKTWMDTFQDLQVDPTFYANRRRSFDEVLPWDHLDYGVKKSFLIEECRRAYAAATTPNCREACSGCGAACYGGGICFEKRTNLV